MTEQTEQTEQTAMTEQAAPTGPTGQPAGEPTGVPAVDALLARLTEADGTPLHHQAELFEELHRALHDTLDPPNR